MPCELSYQLLPSKNEFGQLKDPSNDLIKAARLFHSNFHKTSSFTRDEFLLYLPSDLLHLNLKPDLPDDPFVYCSKLYFKSNIEHYSSLIFRKLLQIVLILKWKYAKLHRVIVLIKHSTHISFLYD